MCGIAGLVGSIDRSEAGSAIDRMIAAMDHRGPDAYGAFLGEGVALGHKRLKIIDLSSAADQPFISPDGRYTLVFNGEIYNYKSIAAELGDIELQSDSDTEVLLHAYIKWGSACLHKMNGMFAFAIWDKEQEELFIARDRLGIKPLYYYQNDAHLVFASELRAVLKSELLPKRLDHASLQEYLSYHTVHAPRTLVEGLKVLLPGHAMRLKGKECSVFEYWHPVKDRDQTEHSPEDASAKVRQELLGSVERRLVSDVPIGAFLSGGIDSSAVVGLMSEVSTEPVHTFSVVFDEAEFSEKKYADLVAKKFKTEHTTIDLRSSDLLDSLPQVLAATDHPSVDGPNTYVVSEATKKAGITVAVSGLGGDELFAGYPVFTQLRKLLNNPLMHSPRMLRGMGAWLGGKVMTSSKGDKAMRLLKQERSIAALYPEFRRVGDQQAVAAILKNSSLNVNPAFDFLRSSELDSAHQLSAISNAEISTYMQNVLLRDADQMSMAHALEIRVPFLDHKLVELVMGLNDAFKTPTYPKRSLVESLGGLLPNEVVHRKKMGFTFPWSDWLRQDMKDLCAENITALAALSAFSPTALSDLWERFLKGDPSTSWTEIWSLVVLNTWIRDNDIQV